jgi:hypothetical protein
LEEGVQHDPATRLTWIPTASPRGHHAQATASRRTEIMGGNGLGGRSRLIFIFVIFMLIAGCGSSSNLPLSPSPRTAEVPSPCPFTTVDIVGQVAATIDAGEIAVAVEPTIAPLSPVDSAISPQTSTSIPQRDSAISPAPSPTPAPPESLNPLQPRPTPLPLPIDPAQCATAAVGVEIDPDPVAMGQKVLIHVPDSRDGDLGSDPRYKDVTISDTLQYLAFEDASGNIVKQWVYKSLPPELQRSTASG